jgi:hypothetical protein
MKSPISQRWAVWCVLACALAAASGCSPQIGDKCSISTDCSQQGDRLCDPTQPGGYCTIFNCEPNSCPDAAVCVAFNEGTCSSAALSRRFQRTFCMLGCESNDDCRSEYGCLDTTNDPLRQIVDANPSTRKFCAPLSSSLPSSPPPSASEPGVCLIPDASPRSFPEAGPDAATGDATLEGAASLEGTTPEGATPIEGGDESAEGSSDDDASGD